MRTFHLAILLLLAGVCCFAQAKPEKQVSPLNPSEPPKTPEALVAFLAPDNSASPERLKEVPPEAALTALTQAQPTATGSKADAIAFLLVLLNSNPSANRDRLFESLHTCTQDPDSCDDRLLSYLGYLFDRGDPGVLSPLLDASQTTDSALVEALGSTYDDLVARDARTVITAISRRPPAEKRRICHMIAVGDGSGFSDEHSNEIIGSLEQISRETGPVASTAMMCLTEIKAFAPR
jgi:hypothetical protein